MHTDSELTVKTHYLYPGTIFAHRERHLVTTILGSCIAVCVWHEKSGVGGINHFLLPLWNGDGLPTPKYGNVAINRLVEKIRTIAGGGTLIAKVFGGASMWSQTSGALAVGERNVELAFNTLEDMKIKVVSQDIGGGMGRKIIFDTESGTVLLRRNPSVSMRSFMPDKVKSS